MNPRRRAIAFLLGSCMSKAFAVSVAPARRIGYLTASTTASQRENDLRAGLKTLGWVEGENLHIEYRRAGNSPERLAEMAKDLLASRVELIVASSTTAVLAARNASTSIPIVTISADPVSNGFAESLRRPGRNITGISTLSPALSGKRLEFLREIAPGLRQAAFLGYAPDPTHRQFVTALESAGRAMSVRVTPILVSAPEDLPAALESLARQRFGAIVVQPLLPIMGLGPAIAEFALTHRLPTCSDSTSYVTAGGLLSYGYDPAFADRRVAIYVDRVLKGARPADIPIETPQKFLLALNMKTAERIGASIPPSLRLRAERIVE